MKANLKNKTMISEPSKQNKQENSLVSSSSNEKEMNVSTLSNLFINLLFIRQSLISFSDNLLLRVVPLSLLTIFKING